MCESTADLRPALLVTKLRRFPPEDQKIAEQPEETKLNLLHVAPLVRYVLSDASCCSSKQRQTTEERREEGEDRSAVNHTEISRERSVSPPSSDLGNKGGRDEGQERKTKNKPPPIKPFNVSSERV